MTEQLKAAKLAKSDEDTWKSWCESNFLPLTLCLLCVSPRIKLCIFGLNCMSRKHHELGIMMPYRWCYWNEIHSVFFNDLPYSNDLTIIVPCMRLP